MRYTLQPLSEYEKREAEKSHNLVYTFLRTNYYDIETYYNVAVMGFLKGIQVYNRREDLRNKFDQSVICWKYMQSEMGNFFRMEQAKKRKTSENIISLDTDFAEVENFYNCIGGKSAEDELMETELLEELLENLSEVQRDILKLKLEGYNNKEVYIALEIPSSSFYKEMNRIKVIMEKLVG